MKKKYLSLISVFIVLLIKAQVAESDLGLVPLFCALKKLMKNFDRDLKVRVDSVGEKYKDKEIEKDSFLDIFEQAGQITNSEEGLNGGQNIGQTANNYYGKLLKFFGGKSFRISFTKNANRDPEVVQLDGDGDGQESGPVFRRHGNGLRPMRDGFSGGFSGGQPLRSVSNMASNSGINGSPGRSQFSRENNFDYDYETGFESDRARRVRGSRPEKFKNRMEAEVGLREGGRGRGGGPTVLQEQRIFGHGAHHGDVPGVDDFHSTVH